MKKTLIQKMLPVAMTFVVIGSVHAAPTYDPTFEADIWPYELQFIKPASDGGYFLSGGVFLPGWSDNIPCSPATTSYLNVPGYDGFFRTYSTHMLYPTAKLTENGKLDCSFTLWDGYPAPAVVQPNGAGKIYAVGGRNTLGLYDAQIGVHLNYSFPYHIARYSEADGQLDNTVILGSASGTGTFEGGFIPLRAINKNAYPTQTVAIDNSTVSTKLVLGGMYQVNSDAGGYYSLWRLTSDGSFDETFQPARFNTPSGINARFNKIEVQPSGKVLVAGDFSNVEGVSYGSFIRFNHDGTVDTAFMNTLNENGDRGIYGTVRDFIVQPDGKIILAGKFKIQIAFATFAYPNIARLNQDGSLDESFTPPNSVMGSVERVNTLALQGDGKIILAAKASYDASSGRNQLMRLNSDGTMDNTFRVKFETGWPYYMETYAAAFDDQCRLVVAFGGGNNETTPTLEFPLTGQVSPSVPGLVRLLVDSAEGCVH